MYKRQLPLLGFNIGIELGQAVILATIVSVLTLADWAIGTVLASGRDDATRWRLRLTSMAVGGAALVVAAGRLPW